MDIDPLPTLIGAFESIAGSYHAAFITGAVEQNAAFGMPQIAAIVVAALFLIISGFVSGSEIAFFSITPQQAEELDESPRSEAIRKLLSAPDKLLATILITNNLVNVSIVVLMSFGLSAVFEQLEPWLNFLLQTVILTFLILLFGEILPKLIANTSPLSWARVATPGINFLMRIFRPLSAVMVRSTKFVNKVVTKQARNITTDELEQALELSMVEGTQDKQMLEGILKFGDTTASEIMTPRVDITGISEDMTFSEVMEVVVSTGYSRLPVFGESQDDIRGVLYSRDLLPLLPFDGGTEPEPTAWHKLVRKPYFVPEARMIDDLLEDFRRLKLHIAIVVDEYGGTRGVVTLEDVLEEIVGDIDDEYDEEEKNYRRLRDDTYIFEGKTLLTDFFRITGLDAEEYTPVAEDCETLAGMLLAIKGDFPKEKEPMVYGRCRFLILDVEHHRIASVRVKVMPDIQTV